MGDEYFQTRRKVVKRKLRLGRLFLLMLCLSLFLFLSYGVFSAVKFLFFSELDTSAVTVPAGTRPDEQLLKTRLNVLVMGLDGRRGDGSDKPRRTDSMLFCSFNTEEKKVAVLAIPRDTFVTMPPDGREDKINHAYAYGGEKMARQAVADFLRAPVSYHVVLDVEGFMRIIDILGGIGLYVENDLDYEDPYQELYIHIKKGYQQLNGEQAVKYIRFRSDELGDVGRVLRQQKFLKAFAEQLFSFNGLSKLPYLQPALKDMLQTDVVWLSFVKMALSFDRYSQEGIDFEMLPGEFETINETSYWVTDEKQVRLTLDKLGIVYLK